MLLVMHTHMARLLLLLGTLLLPVPLGAAEPVDGGSRPEAEVRVIMRARQFEPDSLTLRAGQPVHLVLHNADAELHAFVPHGLLEGVHLTIGGNGAPEFTPTGFKRVIIPSDGRAELRFTPERPGVYRFTCDMPGHEMTGQFVVQ